MLKAVKISVFYFIFKCISLFKSSDGSKNIIFLFDVLHQRFLFVKVTMDKMVMGACLKSFF